MEKLCLESVQVPWKISASDEIETFRADGGALEFSLIADLINDRSKNIVPSQSTDMDIFDGIDIVLLSLTFQQVQYLEFSKPRLKVFGLDPAKYDLPPIDYGDRTAFFGKWFSQQLCPASGLFLVKNSDVKELLHIQDAAMSHYLMTGHDEIINVVAASFTWRVVEKLNHSL